MEEDYKKASKKKLVGFTKSSQSAPIKIQSRRLASRAPIGSWPSAKQASTLATYIYIKVLIIHICESGEPYKTTFESIRTSYPYRI